MPERPDLEYVVPILDRSLRGRYIAAVRVKKPVVLRLTVRGSPEEILVGRTFARAHRRAHFVVFELEDPRGPLEMVVAPMLAGRFAFAPPKAPTPGDLAIGLTLDDDHELRYRDDVQMGKVYLIERGAWEHVPGLESIGLDVLDPEKFTRKAFRALAKKRRDQAKVFLMDKTALDSLGNAYADEVLFAARIHPKTLVRALSDADLDRFHDAIVNVLSSARATIAARAPPIDEKIRDFLSVRGRAGDPCPHCGTKIRKAGVLGHDAFFCPTCQPETRRSGIVDWREVGRDPEG